MSTRSLIEVNHSFLAVVLADGGDGFLEEFELFLADPERVGRLRRFGVTPLGTRGGCEPSVVRLVERLVTALELQPKGGVNSWTRENAQARVEAKRAAREWLERVKKARGDG